MVSGIKPVFLTTDNKSSRGMILNRTFSNNKNKTYHSFNPKRLIMIDNLKYKICKPL